MKSNTMANTLGFLSYMYIKIVICFIKLKESRGLQGESKARFQ